MGNICGKSDSDAFAQPGRVLGSAPPPGQPQRASVPPGALGGGGPSSSVSRVGGPPRTLGGGPAPPSDSPDEARRKAAEAAEVRAPHPLIHPFIYASLSRFPLFSTGHPPPLPSHLAL